LGLVDLLVEDGRPRLLDVQWETAHLSSLGVVAIPRPAYLQRLEAALALPEASGLTPPGCGSAGSDAAR